MDSQDVIRYVGVTGLPGAGKGELTARMQTALNAQGIDVFYYSLSEALREYVRQQNLPIERPVLRQVANELREKFGAGTLASLAAGAIEKALYPLTEDVRIVVIIDAIRNPKEVDVLRQHFSPSFILVAIDAPEDVLVERIISRQRSDEAAHIIASEEAVRQMIIQEAGRGEPEYGHSIANCIAMADWRIDNTGSLDDLAAKVNEFIARKVLNEQV